MALKGRRLAILTSGTLALALVGHDADATGGYFSHGYGTDHKALAGAGAALSLSTQSVATNPAAAGVLGSRLDVDLGLFNPNRQHSVQGRPSGFPGTFGLAPGTVESDSKLFVLPGIGLSRAVGQNGAFAVVAYGNGGMNSNYPAPVFGFQPTGVDLAQLFVAPTYAHRLGGGDHSVGVSAILAYQRFEAKGLAAFAPFSSSPDNLTDNEHANSFGVGARVGYQGQVASWMRVGLSYQTPIKMSHFDSYSGLFAEQGAFDVPQSFVGGVALSATEHLTLALDVQWINYSGTPSVGNPLLPNLMQAPLGDEGGAGFEWEDVTVFKGGVQYRAGDDWTLRAGYSYGEQPIPSQAVLINILAPGVMEQHVSAGVSKLLGQRHGLHLAVTRALSKSVSGPNLLEVPGQQSIELAMDQWDVSLGYSLKY